MSFSLARGHSAPFLVRGLLLLRLLVGFLGSSLLLGRGGGCTAVGVGVGVGFGVGALVCGLKLAIGGQERSGERNVIIYVGKI